MTTKVCVLRSGGDFRPEHVQWLARQVPGLVCLSDVDVPGVKCMPLRTDWPGWWAKMEAFGPVIDGDMLLIDLDTVVFKLPRMPKRTTVLTDFTRPELIGGGFLFVTAADRARCWEAFTTDPKGHMARAGGGGEQAFLLPLLADSARWGADVVSYKVHCQSGEPPAGTKVVCFHGKPRPWDASDAWIPAMPRAPYGDFRDLVLAHKGKRICVMGGAPSLAEHLAQVEADVYISTNGHGADLVRPDYLLAMDERHSKLGRPMVDHLRSVSGAPIISPHPWADHQLVTWPQAPRDVLSGMVATWVAWMMGAEVVILAGMDGYKGDPGYVFEAVKMARDVPGPVRVAGGGPLTKAWPAYDPAEKLEFVDHSERRRWLGIDEQVRIQVRKRTVVRGLEREPGTELTVMRHEVARLLKHRMVVEI